MVCDRLGTACVTVPKHHHHVAELWIELHSVGNPAESASVPRYPNSIDQARFESIALMAWIFIRRHVSRSDGRSNFRNLLFRRQVPFFFAFDQLACDGMDLRDLPLMERKRRLRGIMPSGDSRVLLMEHIVGRGKDLFTAACDQDLEGIVAKWQHGRYVTEGRTTSWLKVKNPTYSQMEGRAELFERSNQLRPRTTKARPLLQLA